MSTAKNLDLAFRGSKRVTLPKGWFASAKYVRRGYAPKSLSSSRRGWLIFVPGVSKNAGFAQTFLKDEK